MNAQFPTIQADKPLGFRVKYNLDFLYCLCDKYPALVAWLANAMHAMLCFVLEIPLSLMVIGVHRYCLHYEFSKSIFPRPVI